MPRLLHWLMEGFDHLVRWAGSGLTELIGPYEREVLFVGLVVMPMGLVILTVGHLVLAPLWRRCRRGDGAP